MAVHRDLLVLHYSIRHLGSCVGDLIEEYYRKEEAQRMYLGCNGWDKVDSRVDSPRNHSALFLVLVRPFEGWGSIPEAGTGGTRLEVQTRIEEDMMDWSRCRWGSHYREGIVDEDKMRVEEVEGSMGVDTCIPDLHTAECWQDAVNVVDEAVVADAYWCTKRRIGVVDRWVIESSLVHLRCCTSRTTRKGEEREVLARWEASRPSASTTISTDQGDSNMKGYSRLQLEQMMCIPDYYMAFYAVKWSSNTQAIDAMRDTKYTGMKMRMNNKIKRRCRYTG